MFLQALLPLAALYPQYAEALLMLSRKCLVQHQLPGHVLCAHALCDLLQSHLLPCARRESYAAGGGLREDIAATAAKAIAYLPPVHRRALYFSIVARSDGADDRSAGGNPELCDILERRLGRFFVWSAPPSCDDDASSDPTTATALRTGSQRHGKSRQVSIEPALRFAPLRCFEQLRLAPPAAALVSSAGPTTPTSAREPRGEVVVREDIAALAQACLHEGIAQIACRAASCGAAALPDSPPHSALLRFLSDCILSRPDGGTAATTSRSLPRDALGQSALSTATADVLAALVTFLRTGARFDRVGECVRDPASDGTTLNQPVETDDGVRDAPDEPLEARPQSLPECTPNAVPPALAFALALSVCELLVDGLAVPTSEVPGSDDLTVPIAELVTQSLLELFRIHAIIVEASRNVLGAGASQSLRLPGAVLCGSTGSTSDRGASGSHGGPASSAAATPILRLKTAETVMAQFLALWRDEQRAPAEGRSEASEPPIAGSRDCEHPRKARRSTTASYQSSTRAEGECARLARSGKGPHSFGVWHALVLSTQVLRWHAKDMLGQVGIGAEQAPSEAEVAQLSFFLSTSLEVLEVGLACFHESREWGRGDVRAFNVSLAGCRL